jgi:hypothetical protein
MGLPKWRLRPSNDWVLSRLINRIVIDGGAHGAD